MVYEPFVGSGVEVRERKLCHANILRLPTYKSESLSVPKVESHQVIGAEERKELGEYWWKIKRQTYSIIKAEAIVIRLFSVSLWSIDNLGSSEDQCLAKRKVIKINPFRKIAHCTDGPKLPNCHTWASYICYF